MERTGLLIIRAWVEEGSSEPLRAQIRRSTDVTVGFQTTLAVSQPRAVVAAVEQWLAELHGDPEAPG